MDQISGLICIIGPTASGKTSLAVALAKRISGAIISADSRQVFRGMDIGTGKDLQEYKGIDHYLINIRDAGDDYHVAHFQDDFQEALLSIAAQGKVPILCGGTGMYIQSVLQHYRFTSIPVNQELRNRLADKGMEELEEFYLSMPSLSSFNPDLSTKKRVIRAIEITSWLTEHPMEEELPHRLHATIFGILLPLEERRMRITDRLNKRLAAGLLQEVEGLLAKNVSADKLKFYGLEYKYATAYLLGEMEYNDFYAKLNTEIHRYAKRQMTYFRKMEKDGLYIHWLDGMKSLAEQVAIVLTHIHKDAH
jgi:tRNA dimethylallyltransferase